MNPPPYVHSNTFAPPGGISFLGGAQMLTVNYLHGSPLINQPSIYPSVLIHPGQRLTQSSLSDPGGGREIPPPVPPPLPPPVPFPPPPPKIGDVYATWMHDGPKLVTFFGMIQRRGDCGGSKRSLPTGGAPYGTPRNSRISVKLLISIPLVFSFSF